MSGNVAIPGGQVGRRQLWRWLGWFSLANAGLFILAAGRYLPAYQWSDSPAALLYVLTTLVSHLALLAVVPAFLLVGMLILLWPRRRLVMGAAVLVAALTLALLVLDANVYVERRFHLSVLTAALFEPSTWMASAVILGIALAFEALLAGSVARWLDRRPGPAGGGKFAVLILLCWFASQGLHIWADAVSYSPVLRFAAVLPVHFPIRAKRSLARLGLIDASRVREARLARQGATARDGDLAYPLKPLDCPAPAQGNLNVLWILIDALRPDAISPALTPTLAAFRERGQYFANHWSGGNSSRMGIFSMFYGLPSTYWQSFYAVEQPPVLLDELRRRGYAFMTASAVGYGAPSLIDGTVFAGVPGLKPEPDLPGLVKNRGVTGDWLDWLSGGARREPFLAFLYYDPPFTGEAGSGPALPPDSRYGGNPKAQALWDQYRSGVRMVDGEVARVLDSLRDAGLDARTLVIISSDHGYEFDDLGLGYYGHAGNFGPYQLRSVLMMDWPGRPPRRWEHRSSHLDLPATLLSGLFGCRNPPGDYSIGRNLFDGVSWEWIIAGSYHAHAIVQPDRLLVSEPGGFVESLRPDYSPDDRPLDRQVIGDTLSAMQRFYRQ